MDNSVRGGNRAGKLIDFRPSPCRSLTDRVLSVLADPIERLLGADRINQIHDFAAHSADSTQFLNRVLEFLEVSFRLPAEDLLRIPATGPVLVVANHPFGALDGIVLGAVLRSVRPDAKLMANYLLGRIKPLADLFILVDPFAGGVGSTANLAGIRQSLRWLNEGGMLAAFPAGEVAHLNLRGHQVRERPWNTTIARIARHSGVPVLPIFFHGRNSSIFQALGMIHPRVRTALLAREVWNKRHKQIELRVGSIIPARKLQAIPDDRQLVDSLRRRTLLLRHRVDRPIVSASTAGFARVVPGVDPKLMSAEIARLPVQSLLVDADGCRVYCTDADSIPNVLREIGRLREITFRASGEGTGKAIDLDEFDSDYLHLFVWQKEKCEIVGAYRPGRTDVLLEKFGPSGFYTRTLFNFDHRLLDRIGIAIEMGRSFVRLEYQRSFAPLLLLWEGIGTYCVRNPRYKSLFGPVSISNDYSTVSKRLMVEFLKANHLLSGAKSLVRPRRPFRSRRMADLDDSPGVRADQTEIAELIGELEPDGKGMPVLLRQYLKLGAQLLAFNVDPAFNHAIDGLILVDLTKTQPRVLSRYMGKTGYAEFMNHHRGIVA
jgi:putative hemolysin